MSSTKTSSNDCSNHYDAIVLGVGGMGSATVYELAKRGKKVLGIDQYTIPNNKGSSHGETRIIRLAYYQDPKYVPLVRRAYALWKDLQSEAGEEILKITGSIDAGSLDSKTFDGSRKSCDFHQLPYEVMTASELTKRFPGYRFPEEIHSIFQPDGGILFAEKCITSFIQIAQRNGAHIRENEQVISWDPSGEGVKVVTDSNTYFADRLIITAGPWFSKLFKTSSQIVQPERQVYALFQPKKQELFTASQFPVFNLMADDGHYYGFPALNQHGFKFGRVSDSGEIIDPDDMERTCNSQDEAIVSKSAERFFPDGAGKINSMTTCIYSNTIDENFIIDTYSDYPQVSFAAGFSGHGFKFCSVIGEIMADLAEHGATNHDIEMFRINRLIKDSSIKQNAYINS